MQRAAVSLMQTDRVTSDNTYVENVHACIKWTDGQICVWIECVGCKCVKVVQKWLMCKLFCF